MDEEEKEAMMAVCVTARESYCFGFGSGVALAGLLKKLSKKRRGKSVRWADIEEIYESMGLEIPKEDSDDKY